MSEVSGHPVRIIINHTQCEERYMGDSNAAPVRKGRVELLWLDGPREREFTLPNNWDRLSRAEREAVWRPVWRSLCGDSVEFRVRIEGEDD